MSKTILSSRLNYPIANPNFLPSQEDNGWEVVYNTHYTFKISEVYMDEATRSLQIIQLNSRLVNPTVDLHQHTNSVRAIFSKFKDFEVSNVKFKISVGHRTVSNPIITDYEANPSNFVPIDGVGNITFNYIVSNHSHISIPKQITINNIPLRGSVHKCDNRYYWDLDIDNKMLYLQLVYIKESYDNLALTFYNFTDHQQEKYEDLKYYLDKLNQTIDNSITLFTARPTN